MASSTCRNCDAPLTGPFCAQCGQRATPPNPTLREFATEAFGELTSLDGKVGRTLWRLMSRPGFLTVEHNAGRRARYMPPVRLYLVLSVAYFAVAAVTPLNLRYTCSSCPPETRVEQERQMGEAIGGWTPRAVFVCVPVFTAFVLLVTWRRDRSQAASGPRHYPQHLYFSIHVHAAWFAAGLVVLLARAVGVNGLGFLVLLLAMFIWAWAYFVTATRRVYGFTLWGAVWRTAAISFLHWIVLFTVLLVIGLVGAGVLLQR